MFPFRPADFPLSQDISVSSPVVGASNPPPIPPRPAQQQRSTFSSAGYGLGSYGGSYGGMSGMYGSSMYGGYGGYSGMGYGGGMYGGGGYGAMNRFGADNSYATNSFVRQAEENSRQAFQSVESVVQAFGSVAMMLDSTFFAVYNSFRAVIGVADQLSRVKTHFVQIFSALAIIKTLRWLLRKLLVFLRLRKAGLAEDVWNEAASPDAVQALMAEQGPQAARKSTWPIMMFFAIVLGGPWLIWKLLSSMYSDSRERFQ